MAEIDERIPGRASGSACLRHERLARPTMDGSSGSRMDGLGAWRWDRKADGRVARQFVRGLVRRAGGYLRSRRATRGGFHRPAASCCHPSLIGWAVGTTDIDPVQGPEFVQLPGLDPVSRTISSPVVRRITSHVVPASSGWTRRVLPFGCTHASGAGVGRCLGTSHGAGAGAFVPTGHVRADRSRWRHDHRTLDQPRVSTVLEVGQAAPRRPARRSTARRSTRRRRSGRWSCTSGRPGANRVSIPC